MPKVSTLNRLPIDPVARHKLATDWYEFAELMLISHPANAVLTGVLGKAFRIVIDAQNEMLKRRSS